MNTIIIAVLVAIAFALCIIYGLRSCRLNRNQRRRAERSADAKVLIGLDAAEGPENIRTLLKAAAEHRSSVRVTLHGCDIIFSSTILAVEADALLIDALYPDRGNLLAAAAAKIFLELSIKQLTQVPFQCVTCFTGHTAVNGYPALRLALPQKITRKQKRQYHRVELTAEDDVRIRFYAAPKTVADPVINISGAGLGFYSNCDTGVLHHGKKLEQVTVTAGPAEAVEIECMTIVYAVHQLRYPVVLQGTTYRYYYGAEFTRISDENREAIIQYVIDKEREALKKAYPPL